MKRTKYALVRGGVALAASVVAVIGCLGGVSPASAAPAFSESTIASGLDIPWDLEVAPDGVILTGERRGRFVAIFPRGGTREVRADLSSVFVNNETGLMGLALDPRFAQTRRVYSCQSEKVNGGNGSSVPGVIGSIPLPWPSAGLAITVRSWRVSPDWSSMTREGILRADIPVNAGGRHAGCGLTSAPDGTLWVGTGDNAIATNAQSWNSLGGKVLHINANGTPARGNPNPSSPIFSLGHRNVQDIDFGPRGVYAIEQGTNVDDELNLLVRGGNYGYKPDRTPGIYDETVPMTDPSRVPGAIGAVWRSGNGTIATPALKFLPAQWGPLAGSVVISALKGKHLEFVTLTGDGRGVVRTSQALVNKYGRLRALAIDRDGSLLVSTSNGGNADKVIRLRP